MNKLKIMTSHLFHSYFGWKGDTITNKKNTALISFLISIFLRNLSTLAGCIMFLTPFHNSRSYFVQKKIKKTLFKYYRSKVFHFIVITSRTCSEQVWNEWTRTKNFRQLNTSFQCNQAKLFHLSMFWHKKSPYNSYVPCLSWVCILNRGWDLADELNSTALKFHLVSSWNLPRFVSFHWLWYPAIDWNVHSGSYIRICYVQFELDMQN